MRNTHVTAGCPTATGESMTTRPRGLSATGCHVFTPLRKHEDAPCEHEVRQLVRRIKRMPEIRADKVKHAKWLILTGKLETPARIDETARRIMKELGL